MRANFARNGDFLVVQVSQPGFVLDDGQVRVFDATGMELSSSPLNAEGTATSAPLAAETTEVVVEISLIGRPSDLIYLIFDEKSGRPFPHASPVTFNRECCVPGASRGAILVQPGAPHRASESPVKFGSAATAPFAPIASDWSRRAAMIAAVILSVELAVHSAWRLWSFVRMRSRNA